MHGTTPVLLLRFGAASTVLAVLAAAALLWASHGIGTTARTIGRDAEPSVALALGMTAGLASLNAAAIGDALTDSGAASGTSLAYRNGSLQMEADLLEAARNITYGEAEAGPLRRLQQALAMYREAVVESRYIGAGDALITARRVEWASRVNRDIADPEARALAAANATVLDAGWTAFQAWWWLPAGVGFALLAGLAAGLVAVQLWLVGRVRRLLNPLLAASTLVTVALALWFGGTALVAHATLRSAKQDAYDSLRVLFEAKSTVSMLRADLSLWLLDPAERDAAQHRMDAAGDALIGTHDPALAAGLVAALNSALSSRTGGKPPGFGGLLGQELGNITYGLPEQQAATDAVARIVSAQGLMRSVQQEALRDRGGAVGRWLAASPGGGIEAFAAVQSALDRTVAVNQAAFDRDTAAVEQAAGLMAPVGLVALLAAVGLAWGGLWLRLREYR